MPASATLWRIHVTDNNGNAWVNIAELELRTEHEGSDVTSGETASASDEGYGAASQAIDDNATTTSWVTDGAGTQWLQISFASAVEIVQYSIIAHNNWDSDAGGAPKDWTLESSIDGGSNWVVEDTVTGETAWAEDEARVFNVVPPPPAIIGNSSITVIPAADLFTNANPPETPPTTTKWRLYITANNGGDYTCLPEIVLKDEQGGDSVLSGATATANSELGAGAYSPVKAIDGLNYTAWFTTQAGAIPSWLEITIASEKRIVEYDIQGRNNISIAPDAVKDWELQSSIDGGTTWRTQHSASGQTGWANNEVRTFTLDVAPHFVTGSSMALSAAADLLFRIEGRPTIIGNTLLTLTPAAVVNFYKTFEGDSSITLTAAAVLNVKRNIVGSASIALASAATLAQYHLIGSISGNSGISLSAAASFLTYKRYSIAGASGLAMLPGSLLQAYTPLAKKTISQRKYLCTFTAAGESDIVIPVSSITGSLSTLVSSVSVVVPNGVKYAAEIAKRAAGNLVISAIEIYTDGTSAQTDTQSFTVSSISQDKGGRSFSVTVRATATLTPASIPKRVDLQSVVYIRTNEQGKRKVRCGLDKDLLPSDLAALSADDDFIVDRITQVVNGPEMFMELMEA